MIDVLYIKLFIFVNLGALEGARIIRNDRFHDVLRLNESLLIQVSYEIAKNLQESVAVYDEVLEMDYKHLGFAITLRTLGDKLRDSGALFEAEKMYQRGFEMKKQLHVDERQLLVNTMSLVVVTRFAELEVRVKLSLARPCVVTFVLSSKDSSKTLSKTTSGNSD